MTKRQFQNLKIGDHVSFRYGDRSKELTVSAIHKREETLNVKHAGHGAEFIGYSYRDILKVKS